MYLQAVPRSKGCGRSRNHARETSGPSRTRAVAITVERSRGLGDVDKVPGCGLGVIATVGICPGRHVGKRFAAQKLFDLRLSFRCQISFGDEGGKSVPLAPPRPTAWCCQRKKDEAKENSTGGFVREKINHALMVRLAHYN